MDIRKQGKMGDHPVNSHQCMHAGRKDHSTDYLPAFFLTVAIFFLPSESGADSLDTLAIVFVSIVLEAIPFMLFGSLVGGFIEVFVSRERMTAFLPSKGWASVCIAAGAGIVFPVCECAVVPVVRRLIGKGLPFSAAIAYLLGGPIVNPVVAASTALAYGFDWRMTVLRLTFGYGIAVAVGLVMGRMFSVPSPFRGGGHQLVGHEFLHVFKTNPSAHDRSGGDCSCNRIASAEDRDDLSECGCEQAPATRLDNWMDRAGIAFSHATDDFLAVGHYLVIGAFVAALAQTYIDRSFFSALSGVPILSVGLMMILAILLNLCSEADAFIAASFQGLMSAPAQMAFLLTGPMLDVKLLLMYQTLFRKRVIALLSLLILAAVLTVSVGFELFERGIH